MLWAVGRGVWRLDGIGERGDLSRLFVMGSSSGGNLAYHAGLHSPSKITGLILNQPYFGGTTRTKSEAASDEDPVLPLRANDTMWQRMFVEMLERAGADVVGRFDEDGSHAAELFDAAKAEALCEEVKEFVHGCC
ncbi:probable carboxylesterase 8 [Asparagus officinalis]|uniref:probable carboxylesterase 8 n=1 Tax=Asparagus officinalis TaxID=4686 RepID=UPI00098E5D42|nr:probable carboxylesterase 8 [Asparagus officinalis]